jgi:hypothetical protein
MSANTKIIVLRRKEVFYTAALCLLGIAFLLFLFVFLLPGKEEKPSGDDATHTVSQSSVYIPGIYATELILGRQSVNVEVIVNDSSITSVRLSNLSDSVATMYPLLTPTLESIGTQLCEHQDLSKVSYRADSKYTSLVLLEAIQSALHKAMVSNQEDASENTSENTAHN